MKILPKLTPAGRCALLALLVFPFATQAQQAAAVDSIKIGLANAKTDEEKVYWMDNLSRTLMNVKLEQADSVGNSLIQFAEETRKRKLMVEAYMSNGLRCGYFAGRKDYLNKSIGFYEKGLDIARQNKMENEISAIQLRLALVYLVIPDKDKALNYVNQAFSVVSTLPNDSLKVEAHTTYGQVYMARNDKTLSLRHFLTALRIAEEIKNSSLMRACYVHLSSFYSRIEDYDKAIDYYTYAYKILDQIKERNVPYQRAIDMNNLGNLYAAKKNYDIAINYYNRSINMADSLKFSSLKLPGYISLLNQFLRMDEPQKALEYMESQPGRELVAYLNQFGMNSVVDQTYAVILTETGNYDSARVHFERALNYFEKGTSDINKMSFYGQLARFYQKTGENDKAIEYYLNVKEMGERNGMLESVRSASRQLDSLYLKKGNFEMASLYGGIYYKYKDSIEKLNREKELAQVEAADEQQRQERIVREKEEAKRKRYSIQYFAITIGIAVMFIIMVMLGFFRVSAATIRIIGFFAFLLFFEFIFLIFKKNIYGITHGEPLKDLAFVIALAALLVPLHHWLEHKVIHFLTSHHMLKLRSFFAKKDA